MLALEPRIIDATTRRAAIAHARKHGVVLPRFHELAEPAGIPESVKERLANVDPNRPDPLNLFRIHWQNSSQWLGLDAVPRCVEIPSALTGVPARIVMALGNSFPLIGSHKVLAAYGCLVQRLVTGQFDPTEHKAVWPSTGNYCRGGIAISRILRCRGIAVLPEGMSEERFDWLKQWISNPAGDIIRTPGSESNVKEIYDRCDQLSREKDFVIINQFREFGNYLAHRLVTGPALARIFLSLQGKRPLRAAAFVCGTGSAGTLAAGDYLKERLGTKIAVTEPLECPTLLKNGYGEHSIQGIGDKHVPLIHNVFNTDFIIGVSDRVSDLLNVLFNSVVGRAYLAARFGLSEANLDSFRDIGLSGLANLQAAIKIAKYYDFGPDDVVLTVATDGAELYKSEIGPAVKKYCRGKLEPIVAAEICGNVLTGCEPAYTLELTHAERSRIFNLGYYTWVEQRGVPVAEFDVRRRRSFWDDIANSADAWDEQIAAFNAEARLN